MTEKLLSILLAGSMLLSTANFVVPFASYYSNYHFFSEVACINKSDPSKHCNGYCQLEKMLKKENKDSGNNKKANLSQSIQKDFFCSTIPSYATHPQARSLSWAGVNETMHSLYRISPPSPPPQFG